MSAKQFSVWVTTLIGLLCFTVDLQAQIQIRSSGSETRVLSIGRPPDGGGRDGGGRDGRRRSGGPSPERIIGYMDRNQNGVLEPDELSRMPSSFREGLQKAGVDLSRPVPTDKLKQLMPRMMEEMRARRDAERQKYAASRSSQPQADYGRGDFRRGRDDGRRSSGSKPTTTTTPKPRITVDLQTKFQEMDKNHDGQIGMYEWDRAKRLEFLTRDYNGDGFLTPKELAIEPGSKKPTTPTSTTVVIAAPRQATPSGSETEEPNLAGTRESRFAQYVFKSLDKDKDGTLTAAEWERSRTTRKKFKKAGIAPPLPANLQQFTASYLQLSENKGEKKKL